MITKTEWGFLIGCILTEINLASNGSNQQLMDELWNLHVKLIKEKEKTNDS